MSKILLESFRTAYANMELSPLITPKEVENFRVEYGTEVLEELEQLVEDDPSGAVKLFLRDIAAAVSLHCWLSFADRWTIAILQSFSRFPT